MSVAWIEDISGNCSFSKEDLNIFDKIKHFMLCYDGTYIGFEQNTPQNKSCFPQVMHVSIW